MLPNSNSESVPTTIREIGVNKNDDEFLIESLQKEIEAEKKNIELLEAKLNVMRGIKIKRSRKRRMMLQDTDHSGIHCIPQSRTDYTALQNEDQKDFLDLLDTLQCRHSATHQKDNDETNNLILGLNNDDRQKKQSFRLLPLICGISFTHISQPIMHDCSMKRYIFDGDIYGFEEYKFHVDLTITTTTQPQKSTLTQSRITELNVSLNVPNNYLSSDQTICDEVIEFCNLTSQSRNIPYFFHTYQTYTQFDKRRTNLLKKMRNVFHQHNEDQNEQLGGKTKKRKNKKVTEYSMINLKRVSVTCFHIEVTSYNGDDKRSSFDLVFDWKFHFSLLLSHGGKQKLVLKSFDRDKQQASAEDEYTVISDEYFQELVAHFDGDCEKALKTVVKSLIL